MHLKKKKIERLVDLNISSEINNDVFESKHRELNQELFDLNNSKNDIIDIQKIKAKEERRLKQIEKELRNTKTIHQFDDEVFKKIIKKVIIGDYNENGSYNPNVVKFVLNITGHDNEKNGFKFLSLEVDERLY